MTPCTSGIQSGGDCSMADGQLCRLAGAGDWQEGKRFQSSASAETVKEWVEGLEY